MIFETCQTLYRWQELVLDVRDIRGTNRQRKDLGYEGATLHWSSVCTGRLFERG